MESGKKIALGILVLSTFITGCLPKKFLNPVTTVPFNLEAVKHLDQSLQIQIDMGEGQVWIPNDTGLEAISSAVSSFLSIRLPKNEVQPSILWKYGAVFNDNEQLYPYINFSNPQIPIISFDFTNLTQKELTGSLIGAWLEANNSSLQISPFNTQDENILSPKAGQTRIAYLQNMLGISTEDLLTHDFETLIHSALNGLLARCSVVASLTPYIENLNQGDLQKSTIINNEAWDMGKELQSEIVHATLDRNFPIVIPREGQANLIHIASNYIIELNGEKINLNEAIIKAGMKYGSLLSGQLGIPELTEAENELVELGKWLGILQFEIYDNNTQSQVLPTDFEALIQQRQKLTAFLSQRTRLENLLTEAQENKGYKSRRAINITERLKALDQEIAGTFAIMHRNYDFQTKRANISKVMHDIHWRRVGDPNFDIQEYLKMLQASGTITKAEVAQLAILFI
ncbi:MAG: hypothetical protein JW870_09270 [Candidatus Delongbacteria bacterium]|nr:hypothetical protein [Candidatus Delongbacteria bacterium]